MPGRLLPRLLSLTVSAAAISGFAIASLPSLSYASNLDVNSQQQLVYTRLVHRADGRSWSDIFTLEQGEERRLTYEQRYRDVRWLSGGHNQPRRMWQKG